MFALSETGYDALLACDDLAQLWLIGNELKSQFRDGATYHIFDTDTGELYFTI